MKLIGALNWRYAVKQFSDEKITAAELKDLHNSARLNASPTNIIVVRSQDDIVMEV